MKPSRVISSASATVTTAKFLVATVQNFVTNSSDWSSKNAEPDKMNSCKYFLCDMISL